MLYLGGLLFAGGYVLQWAQSFEGIVVVGKGRTEQWATRPAEGGGTFSTAHRNMPAEVIGFDNPRAAIRVLGTKDSYDAASLPFRLKLTDAVVLERRPEQQTLEVILPGKTTSAKVKSGQKLELAEGTVVMGNVEPWRGLFRDGRGEPLAAISLKSGDDLWSPVVFVDAKSVLRPNPDVAVSLHWFPDETQARAPLPDNMPTTIQTRWGVNDAGRTHWFEALTPGTGVTASDGTEYTLLDVVAGDDEDAPPVSAIVVGKKTKDKKETLRVEANNASPDSEIVLNSWRDSTVVRFHAWRDGAAIAMIYNQGKHQETTLLNEGDELKVESDTQSLHLRLDQIMSAAIPIIGENSFALTLKTPDGELRLREGQSVQLKESRLRFRRMPQPPLMQYTFQTLATEKDKEVQEFSLSPGDSHRIGQWRFTNDIEHPDNETIAVLHAKRLPGTPTQYLGALLFLIGALGLTVFRFAGWHSTGHEDAATIFEEDKWTAVPPEDNDNTT